MARPTPRSSRTTDDLLIPDNDTGWRERATIAVDFGDGDRADRPRSSSTIDHTYKGDLSSSSCAPPPAPTVVLQEADASSGQFGTKSYTVADFEGELADGVWTLHIADHANLDEGTLTYWSVELTQ